MEFDLPHCGSEHQEIMYKLSEMNRSIQDIHTRMEKDMDMIKPTYDDLNFRNRVWNIIKWVGFGSSAGAIYKLFELLSK